MEFQLKACPFCGGRPVIEGSQRGFIDGVSTHVCYIRCHDCNARSPRVNLHDYGCTSTSHQAIREVAEAWNGRVDPDAGNREFVVKPHR